MQDGNLKPMYSSLMHSPHSLVALAIVVVAGCGGANSSSSRIIPVEPLAPAEREELLPFEQDVVQLPQDEQIEFWIEELRALSDGRPCHVSKAGRNEQRPLDWLASFGEDALEPLLELITEYSERSEWTTSDPTEESGEFLPHSDVMVHTLWCIQEMPITDPGVEAKLLAILDNSCRVNDGKQLWGLIPVHTADTLYKRFRGYAEPKMLDNNALDTPESYLMGR